MVVRCYWGMAFQVSMVAGVIRESHCKWLNALEWWLPGVAGLRMVALCYWGM